MKPKHLKRALADVTSLTDGGLDARLDALVAAKQPAEEVEEPSSENEMGEAGELTPDEVEKLREMLSKMGR